MKIYYHLCGALLEEGSVILPGSYGLIINNIYGTDSNVALGNPITLFYEEKLEDFRKLHAPDKPSRLQCVFVCHSLQNLKDFKAYSSRHFQFGYQVEVIGDVVQQHLADWMKYDNKWSNVFSWKTEMDRSICDYWNEDRKEYLNNPNSPLEILLPNKLRVIKRVI